MPTSGTALDTFPIVAASPGENLIRPMESSENGTEMHARRRRKSSGLPDDPRGDTGAMALSTLKPKHPEAAAAAEKRAAHEKLHKPHSKRRKAKSLLRRWKSISIRHTWLNPLIVVLAILAVYALNPTSSNPLHCAIFLSYAQAPRPTDPPNAPIQYGKGAADFAFVAFYMLVLSFTREFLMQRLIRPIAVAAGIRSRAKQSRFMEQFYTAMYFAIFGPFGLFVMSRSPVWYFNTSAMFEDFPHRTHEALFKAYYLLQASYWAQQAVVLLLQLEKPRKDFKELVGHHVITLALIWLSYRFHFTYMGLAVYITHDISDFFLATSKVLNYLDASFTIPYFALFIGVWAYCRHYLNLRILLAVLTTFRTVGPFELNWETQQYKCWISQWITFSLLACLQSVNIFWFFLILRIAYKYAVTEHNLADERSEYGSEDEGGVVGVDGRNRAGSGMRREETTAEKRQKYGIKPEDQPSSVMMNGSATGPTVLLNGEPVVGNGVTSAYAKEGVHSPKARSTRTPRSNSPRTRSLRNSSSSGGNNSNGNSVQTVEIQSSEKRRVR
ncbi:MAG: hypothetical protein M1828_005835 [Chrysothrix sp. TS-e1954]|nr:MAG: hypothetical protein M1828_005835 [Chrysothrix sp. TS-e1954]